MHRRLGSGWSYSMQNEFYAFPVDKAGAGTYAVRVNQADVLHGWSWVQIEY